MRLITILLLCLCFVPVSIFSQERISTVAVGPYNDQFRIVIAFVEPSAESYKMQSMIIDMDPIKNSQEQPASVYVDLTSTVGLFRAEKRNKGYFNYGGRKRAGWN